MASSDWVTILYARVAVVPCMRPCSSIRVAMNTLTTDSVGNSAVALPPVQVSPVLRSTTAIPVR